MTNVHTLPSQISLEQIPRRIALGLMLAHADIIVTEFSLYNTYTILRGRVTGDLCGRSEGWLPWLQPPTSFRCLTASTRPGNRR